MNYAQMIPDLQNWDRLFGGGIPTQEEIESVMRGEFDAETRQKFRSFTHHPVDQRGEVVHTAFSTYPGKWSFREFERFVSRLLASVPDDKKDSATVELTGGFDETTELTVKYVREQTDEEWGLDAAHALMHVRKGESDDLRAYERLKRKFGNGQSPQEIK